MEEGAEHEGNNECLEDGHFVSEQVFQVEMPIEEFMHQFIPFSGVLIVCCCVPKILIELAISKT